MKVSVILAFMFCSLNVMAHGGSGTVGDGGHGVACSDGAVQVLDLFEARRIYSSKWAAHYSERETNPNRICEILQEKKRKLRDFYVDEVVLRAFDDACDTTLKRALPKLPDTGDYGLLQTTLPKNCKVVQLAFHTQKKFSKIFVNANFVYYLGDEDLAALILHERLHDALIRLPNTIAIRQIVGFAFADKEFQKRNIEELYKLLDKGRLANFK